MMTYRIQHITKYEYVEAVSLCQNIAHLTPCDDDRQSCESSEIRVDPEPAVTVDRLDYFGNIATYFTVQEPHRELKVTAHHLVAVGPAPYGSNQPTPAWEQVRDRLSGDLSSDWLNAYQFAFDSRAAYQRSEFADYAARSFTPGRPILEAALDLTRRIHGDFVYDPRATTVATPVWEVFENRRGVCQDFAHFEISCLRSLGLPAKYVSGYLSTVPPPGRARLIGADATHAWVSVFCGDIGWIDVDPTNDQIPSDRHILVARGRDYDDVSPVKGVILGGGAHTITVSVDVRPIVPGEVSPTTEV